MRRFVQDNLSYSLEPPAEFQDTLYDLCILRQRLTGTVLDAVSSADLSLLRYTLCTRCTIHALGNEETEALQHLIAKQLKLSPAVITVNSAHRRYKSVIINGKNKVKNVYSYGSMEYGFVW